MAPRDRSRRTESFHSTPWQWHQSNTCFRELQVHLYLQKSHWRCPWCLQLSTEAAATTNVRWICAERRAKMAWHDNELTNVTFWFTSRRANGFGTGYTQETNYQAETKIGALFAETIRGSYPSWSLIFCWRWSIVFPCSLIKTYLFYSSWRRVSYFW